ncbi:peptidase M14 [Psychroflexus sp. MES1-P1E]|nr:peptidase M14 [Psychroflexus sp. MES1-P1E]
MAIVRANVSVITTQELSNLTVDPTFSVDINTGQVLNITGDVNNEGSFTGEGEVVLNGTSAQSISGGGSFENLRLDNPTSLDFTDPADLFGVVYVDQGTLNTNGNLSLRCNFGTPGKTAQVGSVGGTIVGDVTVEQCYPARRAFRFLSPSVTTATSIRENWQENPVGYLDNPSPGYGTHITGVSPGSANASVGQDGNNGFDYNPSGNASMFTFDNSTPSWDRVTNANGVLTAGQAYRLFLRGDRSIDITINGSPPTATRLSTTGVLAIGAQTETNLSNTANAFNFIGNPYQAQVDLNSLIMGSTNISSAEYYVWDPTLGGSPTPGSSGGRGAYVTVELPAGTNSASSSANEFLQPMQAAFVRTNTDAPASVTFQEAMKAVNEIQTDVKSNSVQEYINIQLFNANSFAQGETPSDGLRINFNKSFSVTTTDDSPKLSNLDENLARLAENTAIAIERRPLPQATEELPLFINQYRRESYVMKFDMTDNLTAQIFVKDNYLETLTEITSSDNIFSFTIESSIPESVASDRFSLVFEPVSLSTEEQSLVNLSLYPNPTKGNFSVSGIDSGQDAEVKIYNLIGQQVYTIKLSGQSSIEITDFNGTTGVYLVKLKTNQGEKTFKLIKE